MKNLSQLLLNFKNNQNFNYDDFYVSKSNYFAFQLIEKWPKWEKNILNIYGEKFSGKTHLSNIFLNKNKGFKINEKEINENAYKKFKLYELDLVSHYYIDSFTNEKIIYKIIYNSTPDKFISEFTSNNFKLNTSNSIWSVE